MKRTAALLRVTVLGLIIGLVAAGGLAVYYYTLPPNSLVSPNAVTRSSSAAVELVTNQGQQFLTVEYNGTSYQVPAKGANSPSFPCPVGTAPGLCTLLQETCGNGVGPVQEPWKTCYNCIFDAGCSGDNSLRPLHARVLEPSHGMHGG